LHIHWRSVEMKPQIQVSVPVFAAELILTMVGEVITDASWALQQTANQQVSAYARQIQQYLLSPQEVELQIALQKQGTVYSNSVWEALLTIPCGQVLSYSALAAKLGSGPRAVAQACRNNPYAGLVPCHRVVYKSGIGGFMGHTEGGFIALKQQILAHERVIASPLT